ncbi:two-component regulator system yiem receptor component protein [Spiroplasma sabaudiense Ar-1343]|uniref:Two-component regulator system yiem receptor component protein n=1 Tax=Spiroplasma sabaudiense Ar-1343 TaxID=1276257 RepID=W6AAY2_9MOLU|nr:VWA domain-containing protein [Spiroplasma sabaudiense]AHI54166.1 two-component regulator system yiem receptor component protein [Spiroplasma sabaudiense Ar-1343]
MASQSKIVESKISENLDIKIKNFKKNWTLVDYYEDFYKNTTSLEKKELTQLLETAFEDSEILIRRFLSQRKIEKDLEFIEKMKNYSFDYKIDDVKNFLILNNSDFKEEFYTLPGLYKEVVIDDWERFLSEFAANEVFNRLVENFKVLIKPLYDKYYRNISKYTNIAKENAFQFLDTKLLYLKTLPEFNDYISQLEGIGNDWLVRKINESIKGYYNHWAKVINNLKPNEKILKNIKVIEKNLQKNNIADQEEIDLTLTQVIDLFEPNLKAIKKEQEKISSLNDNRENFENIIKILETDVNDEFLSELIVYINESANKVSREIKADIYGVKSFIETAQPLKSIYGPAWGIDLEKSSSKDLELVLKISYEMQNNLVLQRLFEILGKMSGAKQEIDSSRLQKSFRKKYQIEESEYPEEILGLKLSADFDRILSSELAYLKNPILKKIFMAKFLEQKFLTFDYKNIETLDENDLAQIKNLRSLKEDERRGPIILIIDISGSMHGTPELVSKAAAIVMSSLANRARRKIFLITFSTEINFLDLTSMHSDIKIMYDFLFQKFSDGGTDFSLPLEKSLDIMHNNQFKNADVLMISDFLGEQIKPEIFQKIKIFQSENKNRFHALVLSDNPNMGILKSFNNIWDLDPNDINNYRKTIRKLSQIAEI